MELHKLTHLSFLFIFALEPLMQGCQCSSIQIFSNSNLIFFDVFSAKAESIRNQYHKTGSFKQSKIL